MLRISLFMGLVALAVASAQAAPNPEKGNWVPLGAAPSFELGDKGCGQGSHRSFWRDWRGDWWWGPCVPN